MARTFVQAGRRRDFIPTLDHKAGDLVYAEGFYGIAQDDAVATGAHPLSLILDGVWDLKPNFFDASLVVSGAPIYAQPINQATTLRLFHNTASLGASAAVVGRAWATAPAGATYLRVQLFNPNQS